jgi:hypothetical protein
MIRLLLLATLLTSCQRQEKPPFDTINAEFAPYLDVYQSVKYQETGLSMRYIPMEFGIKFQNSLGVCSVGIGHRYITIHPEHWKNLDESSRYELIFHEMIHCDTDGFVKHIDTPGHIMNTYHQNLVDPVQSLRLYFRGLL